MNNPISDLTDAAFEQVEDVGKAVKRDIIKGIPQTVKQQIAGQKSQDASGNEQASEGSKQEEAGKKTQTNKTDPVTGKPVPTKKVLTDLTKATAQFSAAKIKKIREELDKQRLKVSEEKEKLTPEEASKKQGIGPGVPTETEEKAPPDNAVTNTLKGSKSTGEFKGLIGG